MLLCRSAWSLFATASSCGALAVPIGHEDQEVKPTYYTTINDTSVGVPLSTHTSTAPWISTSIASPSLSTVAWSSKSHTSPFSPVTSTCSSPTSAINLSIPSSAPYGAAQVPADFVGFGFETVFLNDYTVGSFSENLVNSVAKRLSAPVIIRMGGSSGDRLLFDPDQAEVKICVDGDCPVGSSATFILGPSYFEGFKRFQNQHFTFQAPFGPDVSTAASLEYVIRAYNAIGADRVAGIALGNEIDIYHEQYNITYTIDQYVSDAEALENNIIAGLNLPDQQIFEVLNLAKDSSNETFEQYSIPTAFDNGLNRNQNTKYAAQHWYQSPIDLTEFDPATEQFYLMNHSAITSKFNAGYLQALQYIEVDDPAVDYVLSETGSSLAGPPDVFQDAFGAALWAVDFNLYCMTQGVKRLDATQRPASHHSLWVPDASTNDANLGDEQNIGPQVRGPYYATPMIADFVGQNPGAVVELVGEDTKTAYAMYDASSGALSQVALVNLNFWSADTSGTRGNISFSIPISDQSIEFVGVQRLRAAAGAHAQGYDVQGDSGMIIWGGETWSYTLDNGEGHLVDGVLVSETVEVCGGVANVYVEDSGASIVYIGTSPPEWPTG